MDLGIRNERALVVGASEGIGYESAKGLLEEGAEVAIVSRDADKLKTAAARLTKATGKAVATFAADVTKAPEVERLAQWVGEGGPKLDILVHAVGGSYRKPFAELSDDEWQTSYDFNILSAVRVIRALLPLLKKSAQGRVVILGAAGARMPYPQQVVSNVHKAGLIALTKTLGAELAPDNIRVNSVSPGRTLTSLWTTRADKLAQERGTTPAEIIQEFTHEIPMGRFGKPEEIAAMVVFLASHKASYVNCQSVLVDGGIARGLV